MGLVGSTIKKLQDPKVRNAVIVGSLVIATLVIVYDLIIRPKL